MTLNTEYGSAPPDKVAEDLGAALARLRLARNITQQALADRAGIGVRTLRRLEAGQGGTLDTLIRLMQALGLESHLAALLPDPGVQPVHRFERGGKERQRARRRAGEEEDKAPWTWDEEQLP